MAAEHLTEQERGYVLAHFDEEEREIGDCILVEDVERIVARQRAEERALVLAEFEALAADWHDPATLGYFNRFAASLVRGVVYRLRARSPKENPLS